MIIIVKIFIDPGHGGTDPGAVGNGLREKDLTLSISLKIRDMLSNFENVQVRLSRESDQTVSLGQRTNMANNWGANYLISVHINAGGGTGFESFINTGSSGATVRNQNVIHAEIMRQLSGVSDRGKKAANFHMLRESRMPAILTENLFIDTRADADKLRDDSFLNRVARGHVNGLAAAFGLREKKPIPTEPPKVYFYTGGYSNESLVLLHNFLMENNFWYIPSRSDTGSLMFRIGAFTEGTNNYNKMKAFLDGMNAWYQIIR